MFPCAVKLFVPFFGSDNLGVRNLDGLPFRPPFRLFSSGVRDLGRFVLVPIFRLTGSRIRNPSFKEEC